MNAKLMLKNMGLKSTQGRIAMLEAFSKHGKPLSLQDLRDIVKFGDTATLYRTVNEFEKIGVVKPVTLSAERAYFELSDKTHHHHVVCTSCGRIEDISTCDIKPLENEIKRKTKFKTITSHSLEFFGTCSNCFRK